MEINKITFDEIQKANESIKTTDIKGKEYADVNQRIKAFRMIYPTGTIQTKMISNENGICIFEAMIADENGKLLATGTAYEKENSTFINKTSYIENCETSAVGRALGMCGFGIDTSVASYEEVSNAIANQNKEAPKEEVLQTASPKQISILLQAYKGDNLTKLLEKNGITRIEDMPIQKASELCKVIIEKGTK